MNGHAASAVGSMEQRVSWFLALLTVSIVAASSPPSLAMIPYYAQDWNTRFGDWNGSQFELVPACAEAARFVAQNALVYAENSNRDGDATYFATCTPPPNLTYYLGFGGCWFEGVAAWLDPQATVKTREANFYHSTDPATLTGWRSGANVYLHWTPDLRFVAARSDLGFIDDPTDKPVVATYVIVRTRGAVTDSITKVVTIDSDCLSDPSAFSYVDTLPGGGGAGPYTYSVRSVPPADYGGGSRDFGTFAFDASVQVAEPHFWSVKPDYQERNYALAMGIPGRVPASPSVAVAFPLQFCVDTSDCPDFDAAQLTLERATAYDPEHQTYSYTPYTVANGGLQFNGRRGFRDWHDHLRGGNVDHRLREHRWVRLQVALPRPDDGAGHVFSA